MNATTLNDRLWDATAEQVTRTNRIGQMAMVALRIAVANSDWAAADAALARAAAEGVATGEIATLLDLMAVQG